MQVIIKLFLETPNRGEKLFLISKTDKGYFAHEIGELTPCSKLFASEETPLLVAHRVNPLTRYGNQYKRSWKPKPFKDIDQAMTAARTHAGETITYH